MKLICIDSNTTLGGHKGLFELLKKRKNEPGKHIFIVPDRYTFGVEKEICEECYPNGTFSVDTVTFTRLAVKGLGVAAANCLSKEGTVLLLHRVICENNDSLVYYKNIRSVGFARELFAAIASLRTGGITPEKIRNQLPLITGNTAQKLTDIAFLYEKYTEALTDKYFDTVSRVELLEQRLEQIPQIADSHIYVLGFNVYSDLQMRLIQKMIRVCPSVAIAYCADKGNSNFECYPQEQIQKLVDWCKDKRIPVVRETAKESLSEPFATLQKHMFGFTVPKDTLDKETKEKVRVFSADNPYEEVKCACREIRHLVATKGYRYKDFAVACNDENYLPVLKTVFDRFGIPCFIDEKFSVSRSFAAQFIFSCLRAVISEYALEDVTECIRSPLSGIAFEDCRTFENYCVKYNVSYSRIFFPFTLGECDEAESVRKKVIKLLDKVPKAGAKVDEYCDFMISVANSQEMKAMSGDEYKDLSNAFLAYADPEPIATVAEEISRLCHDRPSSPSEFSEMLASTLDGMSVSLLPQRADCVFIGNTSDSRFSDIRALFILGANEGSFPVQKSDPLILSCYDSELMRQSDLNVYPLPAEANLLEKFAVIDLCSKPERLYVGYSTSGLAGEKKEKGGGVTEICQKLSLKEKPLVDYYDFNEEDRLLYALSCRENAYYEYVSGKVPAEYRDAVKKYLIENGYVVERKTGSGKCCPVDGYRKENDGYSVSVSMLENYFNCPYKHFLSNVIKAQEKEEGDVRQNVKGSIVHAVLEDYFKNNIKTLRGATDIEKRINDSIDRVFLQEQYKRFREDTVSAYVMAQLRKECFDALTVLTENVLHSRFRPTEFEVRFDRSRPMKLTVDGNNFYFNGMIDRVDIKDNEVVIVDYKTGGYSIDQEKIYDGEKIQLYVYLQYFIDRGLTPAGVFYQPIRSGYSAKGRSYAMEGQMNGSLRTYYDLDDRAEGFSGDAYRGKTVFFNLRNTKGNVDISTEKKHLLNEKDFREISKYVFRLSKQAISDIQNGDIEKNPIQGACQKCQYAKMCGEVEERVRGSVVTESFYGE